MHNAKKKHPMRAAGALVVAAALATTGCSETALQGFTLDADLNTPELMLPLAYGANSEVADAISIGPLQWNAGMHTDEFIDDESSSSGSVRVMGDLGDRSNADPQWEQGLEAGWAGLYAAQRMKEVLDADDYATNPMVARMFIVSAYGETIVSQTFCNGAYGYGPDGGFLLQRGFLAPGTGRYDNTVVVPRDSMWKRVLTLAQVGLEIADAAVAANREAVADYAPFDAERNRLTLNGIAAQAALSLASMGVNPAQNYALANDHAAEVPTDFADSVYMENGIQSNAWWDGMNNNDNISFWGKIQDGVVYGVPAIAQFSDDPRIGSLIKCGDFVDPDGLPGEVDGEADPINYGAPARHPTECFYLGTTADTESENVPIWTSGKRLDGIHAANGQFSIGRSAEHPMVLGDEMRLIQAEVALVNNDLPAFKGFVDEARAYWGADPIPLPATAGELEWPNAEDDAWSILDRERYLALWQLGRRAWDLERWEHPWLTEGHANLPHQRVLLAGRERAFACFPIPQAECNINPELPCPTLLGENNFAGG